MFDIHTTPEASPKNEAVDTATLTERLRAALQHAANRETESRDIVVFTEALDDLSSLETRLEEARKEIQESYDDLVRMEERAVAAEAREKALSEALRPFAQESALRGLHEETAVMGIYVQRSAVRKAVALVGVRGEEKGLEAGDGPSPSSGGDS